MSRLLAFGALLLSFAACSKEPANDEWWVSMTAPGKTIVETVNLAPHEKKSFKVQRTGRVRLGVLVREVVSMKRGLEQNGNEDGGVFLTQVSSGNYIGTYYSAGLPFDLSLGHDFILENRSPIASDVAIYLDPKL